MGPYGARHGFAVITPETHVLPPQWDFGENGRDIAFLSALLTHVEKTLCLDKRRIYVTGLSMGAFTTSSIACQLADRFAAAAPVSGIQNFQWCNPSRPVPVVAFHGTGDKILSYSGGLGPHGLLLPALDGSPRTIGQQYRDGPVPTTMPRSETVRSQTAAWAKRNGCSSKTTARRITHDVTRTQWSCRADGAAELYTIHGGGHNWPGGDPLLAFTPITGPILIDQRDPDHLGLLPRPPDHRTDPHVGATHPRRIPGNRDRHRPAIGNPAEFLDIDMDQVTGGIVLVAVWVGCARVVRCPGPGGAAAASGSDAGPPRRSIARSSSAVIDVV